jgi:hypothetical protein
VGFILLQASDARERIFEERYSVENVLEHWIDRGDKQVNLESCSLKRDDNEQCFGVMVLELMNFGGGKQLHDQNVEDMC